MINKIYYVGSGKNTKIIVEYWEDSKIHKKQFPMYNPYVFLDISINKDGNDDQRIDNTNNNILYKTFYDTYAIKKSAKKPDRFSMMHYLINTHSDVFYQLLESQSYVYDVVYDIEVYADRFPDQEKAEYPISLITLLDTRDKSLYVLSSNEFIKDSDVQNNIRQRIFEYIDNRYSQDILSIFDTDKIMFLHVDDESEIFDFIIENFSGRLFAGWNIENFDNTYIINRAMRLGYKKSTKLHSVLRNHIDYFGYSKKYKLIPETDSYSLKAVSYVLFGSQFTKMDFDVLSYNPDDKDSFIDYTVYNIIDVLVSKMIAIKTNLNDFIYNIATNVGVPLLSIRHPTETNEWVMHIQMVKRGLVVPINKPEKPYRSIQGAYVKEPKPGLYKDVYIYDVGSLYPSMVIAYNVGLDSAVYPYSIEHTKLDDRQTYNLDVIRFVKTPDSILKSLFKFMFIERKFMKSYVPFKQLIKQYQSLLDEVEKELQGYKNNDK